MTYMLVDIQYIDISLLAQTGQSHRSQTESTLTLNK